MRYQITIDGERAISFSSLSELKEWLREHITEFSDFRNIRVERKE